MALAVYSDLKTAVATWLSRVDQTANIVDFITLAHNKLMRTLRVREMEVIDNAYTITAETQNLPALWLQTRTLYITSTSPRTQLIWMDAEKMIERYPLPTLGTPKYFNVVAGQFRFAPVPDSTYLATHVYYAEAAPMSASSDTNWLLTSHPDLYLYGALLEATAVIQDDPRLPIWMQGYDRGIAEITRQSQLAKSGPAMQIRPG